MNPCGVLRKGFEVIPPRALEIHSLQAELASLTSATERQTSVGQQEAAACASPGFKTPKGST